jgi:hypothetical protein
VLVDAARRARLGLIGARAASAAATGDDHLGARHRDARPTAATPAGAPDAATTGTAAHGATDSAFRGRELVAVTPARAHRDRHLGAGFDARSGVDARTEPARASGPDVVTVDETTAGPTLRGDHGEGRARHPRRHGPGARHVERREDRLGRARRRDREPDAEADGQRRAEDDELAHGLRVPQPVNRGDATIAGATPQLVSPGNHVAITTPLPPCSVSTPWCSAPPAGTRLDPPPPPAPPLP